MMKKLGFASLVLAIGFWILPWRLLFAQGSSGFTKLGTVAAPTLSFTDSTCAAGQTCTYQITSMNASGESGPSNTTSASPGATGRILVTWSAPASGSAPSSYNIYTGLRAPNPPTAAQAVSE